MHLPSFLLSSGSCSRTRSDGPSGMVTWNWIKAFSCSGNSASDAAGRNKEEGGQREKSGHSKSFKTSAPSLGPTTTFCHFCLHPQGVPPSPISPPAALLAQPCFCNTQTSVVSSPAPLPREEESQKHEPTLEDVLEEPSSLLEVARHRRSLRASAARPQTLKPDPKSLVGAVVAEQMEIMGRILLQLAPLSHVTQLGYRQAAHRHPGQPATSWQLNASSSAVSWFGGSLFLCF